MSQGDEEAEIAVATMVLEKPNVCPALKAPKNKEVTKFKPTNNYSYNIYKLDEIIDFMLKDGLIKLADGQVIPNKQELGKKKYCKWHHSYTHNTTNCIMFRKTVQEAIRQGKIKFNEEKGKTPMDVDADPFPKMTGMVVIKELPKDLSRYDPQENNHEEKITALEQPQDSAFPGYDKRQKKLGQDPNIGQKSLWQRWRDCDPTVGPLGEPSGKYDYIASYSV